MACLAVDPTILLVVVGILTFLITFCGCVGSLRENICLLQAVSPRGQRVPPGVSPHPATAPRRLFRGPPPRAITLLLPAVLRLPDRRLPPAAGSWCAGLRLLR